MKEQPKLEMHNIEQLTKDYKTAYDKLTDRMLGLQAEIDAIKRQRLRGIKSALAIVAQTREALKQAIDGNKALFKKPRSAVFYGVKVGLQKGKGKLKFDDEDKVIARIKKHFPDLVEALIKREEKLIKPAAEKLSADKLKKIGCELKGTGDQVLMKSADSDIDKMLKALMKDWDDDLKDDNQEEAA